MRADRDQGRDRDEQSECGGLQQAIPPRDRPAFIRPVPARQDGMDPLIDIRQTRRRPTSKTSIGIDEVMHGNSGDAIAAQTHARTGG